MKQVLFLVATMCLTIASGQEPATPNPEPCCLPKQYELRADISISPEYGLTVDTIMPRISMDFIRNMSSVEEEIPGVGFATAILDYNKRMAYVLMNEGSKPVCWKNKLPPIDMVYQCLPKDSKFMGKTRMGYGKQYLDCNTWLMESRRENPSTHIQAHLVVQSEGCVPIVGQFTIKVANFTETVGASFFEFTTGIKDPSVFTIPSICDEAKFLDLSGLSSTENYVIRKFLT